MRCKSVFGRELLPVLVALVVFFSPLLVIAQQTGVAAGTSEDAAASPPLANAPADRGPDLGPVAPGEAEIAAETQRPYTVHLRVDGNLAGRVRAINTAGNLVPVRATISFMQEGRVVGTARSDESGNFQAVGLRPGTYSVVASGRSAPGGSREYIGAFSVRILAFDESAPGDQLLLDMTLMPADDLMKLLGMETPAPYLLPQAPMMSGGGGGGGGGGLGALLGLAGLAGLAGLGQQQQQASPSVP
ncbi:MAG: carboxypeptidase regulatory-like domain-containing protein [Planctomycetes bacterium]|nr:carboxypeptidase regulatory-like domain-containing protein [Planctomycetota bacterium]